MTLTNTAWQNCNSEIFWRDKTTCSHVVQVYEDDDALLNLLEGFVAGGFSANENVVLIATKAHIAALELRLRLSGINLDALQNNKQYLPLDVHEVLAMFMVEGCPDYSLFMDTLTGLFSSLHGNKRPVRAYGEMVAVLLEENNSGATVMLEHFWNSLAEKLSFSLFCAYASSQFSEDNAHTLSNICKAHSAIITNSGSSNTELAFQQV
ncbi:MEDS domain-containing protein [Pontibacter arcticus]|uniref:MEDS domain-containing protein n=1 Tax=Pontibacter arcticus TaxID=2080288 RepID=A0A364RET5_9BACT|nr:MEDS domain-containing protein [Pontibacter arcticus]RAU82803.1 hypothetical protein DP923_06000 [Pontibacter arcticus]